MLLHDMLNTDRFVIIAELEPPKGVDMTGFLSIADSLRGRCQALLIPELSGAVMRTGSLGAACLLRRKGHEVIVTFICRDRNRLALQADLLSASVLDLDNLFVSTGEDIRTGDHSNALPVNDLDAVALLETIQGLQKGIDLSGNELEGAPDFCAGVEVNSGRTGSALEVEVQEIEKKIKAGARYLITQPIYDLAAFENFIRKVSPFKIPVFPRIILLNSVGMARFMCRHVQGALIPDDIIDRLAKSPDKNREGVDIAADTVKRLNGMCRGAVLVAVGRQQRMCSVLEQIQ